MFRYILVVSVIALLSFCVLHAFMRLGGMSDLEISSILWGCFGFCVLCSLFSAGVHSIGFGGWCTVIIPILICCGISILGITHLWRAVGVGVVYLGLLIWADYSEYLDTPYSPEQAFEWAKHPKWGLVPVPIPPGATPRQMRAEWQSFLASLKKGQESS